MKLETARTIASALLLAWGALLVGTLRTAQAAPQEAWTPQDVRRLLSTQEAQARALRELAQAVARCRP